MRSAAIVALLAGVAVAAPAPAPQNLPIGGVANDIDKNVCKPVTLIFARGSIEGGNMGSIVGPGLADGVKRAFPNQVAVQGVDYPADIIGAVTGAIASVAAAGASKMAQQSKKVLSACPSTKLILSGYSQGGEQVRGALSQLGGQAGKVAAVVTFGDPMQMLPFPNIDQKKGHVICGGGDPVCLGGINIVAHLSYGVTSVGEAVDFVKKTIGSPTAGAAAPAGSAAAPGGLSIGPFTLPSFKLPFGN